MIKKVKNITLMLLQIRAINVEINSAVVINTEIRLVITSHQSGVEVSQLVRNF